MSESASKGEASLLRCALSLAADATGAGQLGLTQLLRLSQARVHLRACQVFVHEVHLDTPVQGLCLFL